MTTKKKKKIIKPKPDVENHDKSKVSSAGAPTKYKEEYAKDLIDYFSIPPYETKQRTVMIKGIPCDIDVVEANDFPSLAGFAISIKVHRDTLHEWATAKDDNGQLLHQEFSDAYSRVKDYQEHYILTNGLRGYTKEQFTQFVAVNVLKYRTKAQDESPDTVITNNNFEKMTDEEFAKHYENELKKAQGKI